MSISRQRARIIECLALLPATVLLAPFMGYGMLAALANTFLGDGYAAQKAIMARAMLLVLAQMLFGCAGLACLWILIWRDVDTVKRNSLLRWLVISMLILGITDGAIFLFSECTVTKSIASSTSSILIWTGLLGLPMLLGIRYLYLLVSPSPRAQSGTQRAHNS